MKHNHLTERVIKIILASNLEKFSKITVNLIAKKIDINPSYLSRKFKEDTDFLLSGYIKAERIRRAEKLLKTRYDLNISDISRMVGFSKPDQFRKYFKKRFFINPFQYRKLYKK